MSSDIWALGKIRKHMLTVNFYERFVETPYGYAAWWGGCEEYTTFEDALQHIVNYLEGM